MNLLITTLLLLFVVPQGAPSSPTGTLEGKVVRASNAEPVSGVQIALIPPAPPAQQGIAATGLPPLPQGQQIAPGTNVQIIRTPDGNAQVVLTAPGGGVTALPLDVAANLGLNPANAQSLITAVTDADGKFVFQNLTPGVYTLRAQRQGYLGPRSPQGAYPNNVTKSITVEANQTAKVELGMVQAGVLHGIVRDPDGQPAPNYAVVTARPGYTNLGRAVWLLTGAMNADDRGEYRWPGFAPGEYY